jgi:hypothetical protein
VGAVAPAHDEVSGVSVVHRAYQWEADGEISAFAAARRLAIQHRRDFKTANTRTWAMIAFRMRVAFMVCCPMSWPPRLAALRPVHTMRVATDPNNGQRARRLSTTC